MTISKANKKNKKIRPGGVSLGAQRVRIRKAWGALALSTIRATSTATRPMYQISCQGAYYGPNRPPDDNHKLFSEKITHGLL